MADHWKVLLLIFVALQCFVHGQNNSVTELTTTENWSIRAQEAQQEQDRLVITSCVVAGAVGVVIVAAIFAVQIRRRRLKKREDDALALETKHNPSTVIAYENMSGPQNRLSQISGNYTNLIEQESSSIGSLGSTREFSSNPAGYTSKVEVNDGGVSSLSVPTYTNLSKKRIQFVDNDEVRASCPDWKDKWQNKNDSFTNRTMSTDSGFDGSRNLTKSNRSLNSKKSFESLDSAIGESEQTAILKTQSLQPGIHDGHNAGLQKRDELRVLSLPSTYRQSGNYDSTSYSDSELQVLVASFIKNPFIFTDRRGEQCIFATMSFAIGLFDHKGGTLYLPDMSTQLLIPTGAVREKTILYFSVNSDSNHNKKGQITYSPVINLGPDGTKFDCPVLLSFQHSAILENRYMPMSLRPVIQEGNDDHWREFTYKETLCNISNDRVIMSLDHFSRVKLVGEVDPVDPDTVSIDENTAVAADDVSESTCTSIPSAHSSVVCFHDGACACPTIQKPNNVDVASNISGSDGSVRSKSLDMPVKKENIFYKMVRKLSSSSSSPSGPRETAKHLHLCCIAEPCDEIIKLRVYFAETEGMMNKILLRDAGFPATQPRTFQFSAQCGSLKFALKVELTDQLRKKDYSFQKLTKERALTNPYDHVEFIISHNSRTHGIVEVYQSKRTSNKIQLNPAWGEKERKANLMRQQSSFAIEDVDVINHMIQTRGREPIAFKSMSLAIPHDLMMELCKILDPDDVYLRRFAVSIGIEHDEFRWFKSRGSVTKTMLSFFQAFCHEDSPKDLLQKLHGHLEKIEHLHAAGIVRMYLDNYYKINNPSSESLSSINTSSSSTVSCQCAQKSKPIRSFSVLSADSGYTTGLTTP